MNMKVLLTGSGGREHALAWKLAQSPLCRQLICAPGNAGMQDVADCVNIGAEDIDSVLAFAKNEAVDFVVIGPEAPLALGMADALKETGIDCFGPTGTAARLESSKAFTKNFCTRHGIPTARYGVFTNAEDAGDFIDEMQAPYVIKADGLAAGKGVVIPETGAGATREIDAFFSGRFGEAGKCIVIEEFLHGHEISFFAISDGKTVLPLVEVQDHKRAFDNDTGPNTGGMGAYSPVPGFTAADRTRILGEILNPTVAGMAQEGYPFAGVLFAGLMMTGAGPKLIEYNVRFGDPECQVLLRRLTSDLLEILLAAAKGELASLHKPQWSVDPVVNVVLAAKGYPGAYKKGTLIKGVDAANRMDGVLVFHAGTKRGPDGILLSAGGRVLNITARGQSVEDAVSRAYAAIDGRIDWPDGFCRRDIAWQVLATL